MHFFFKKAFFVDVLIFFIIAYGFRLWEALVNPKAVLGIALDFLMTTLVLLALVGIPWFMVAYSSVTSGRNRLKDLQGGIQYLLEQRKALEDEGKIAEHDKKIQKTADLYNQEIDTLDEMLREFPNRILVGFFFGYRKPRHFKYKKASS